MFVAHSNNVIHGLKDNHIVYGIVSTGDDWELFSYEGINIGWKFYGRLQVLQLVNTKEEIVFNIDSIKELFETLNYMLEVSVKAVLETQNAGDVISIIPNT